MRRESLTDGRARSSISIHFTRYEKKIKNYRMKLYMSVIKADSHLQADETDRTIVMAFNFSTASLQGFRKTSKRCSSIF